MRKPSSRRTTRKASRQPSLTAAARLQVPTPKPVAVKYMSAPPPFKRRENIHPRRILPRVREGREREFHSLTPPTTLYRPLARAFVAQPTIADDLTLLTNTELAQP